MNINLLRRILIKFAVLNSVIFSLLLSPIETISNKLFTKKFNMKTTKKSITNGLFFNLIQFKIGSYSSANKIF